MKKGILAVVAVFATFVILDYIIHSIILTSSYVATAYLWRSLEEMILWLMYLSTLVFSIIFVYIYARFFAKKGTETGVMYGLLMGLAMGTSMGIGSFSVMPIPCNMALTWFLGCIVEMTLAGLWLGLIIKEKEAG
jgi:hypothetical protein